MLLMLGLFAVGLVAGFIDAIAGGGGLLTLPSLLLTGIDPKLALGTNKGQGVFGTATSLHRFWNSSLLDRRRAMQSFPPGLIGAAVGVFMVTRLRNDVLAPLVMVLLLVAAVAMIVQRPPATHKPARHQPWWLAATVAFGLAWYDGFFGPGTGTFLILSYTWLWRDRLDVASANAKVVNFASNLASMVTFAAMGKIVWGLALPMAAGQVIGGWLGAHATIKVGRQLVRYAVIAVSLALIVRLGWRWFG